MTTPTNTPVVDQDVVDKEIYKRNKRLLEQAEKEFEEEGRFIYLLSAKDRKIRQKEFLWSDHNVPVGELTLLTGEGGLGKSTLGLWICARLTRGELPGAYFGTPRAVIIDSREDDFDSILLPRFLAMGGDPALVFTPLAFGVGESANMTFPADTERLETQAKHIEAVLYFCDPITTALGERYSQDSSQDVRKAMTPLAQMGRKIGMTVLGIAHHKKGAKKASEAISGAAGWRDLARCVLSCTKNPDEDGELPGKLFGVTKNNYGPDDSPATYYDTEVTEVEGDEGLKVDAIAVRMGDRAGFAVADAIERNQGSIAEREEGTEAEMWLKEFLSSCGQGAVQDIWKASQAAGLSRNAVRTAKATLKVKSTKVGFGEGAAWVWQLPA